MEKRPLIGLIAGIILVTAVMEVFQPGILAIWPSIAALILVFSTRNVLMGLLGGALVGSILLVNGKFWLAPLNLVEVHLLPNFSSPWKSGAILFTLLLGGFVHLLERGGVLQNLLTRLLHGSGQRKVESGAALFGLVCFFDGLANSLMVGRIFKPMASKSGVSRVRLAYIVDTTSAAVACLAFISTWIAYQLSMIREGFLMAGQESMAQPYRLFFASIPHNYYAWFALIFMGLTIWKSWNIGPMRTWREPVQEVEESLKEQPDEQHGLWRAAIPVAALLGIVFFGIYADGTSRMGEGMLPPTFGKLAMAFSEANVPAVLIIGSAVASILAFAFLPSSNLKEKETRGGIFIEGMLQLFRPVLILIMAWMLSSTLKELDAADYLGGILGDRLPLGLFPVAVFMTGSLISFTTGTSWGTMGLLMPLAIPLVFSLSGGDSGLAMQYMPMVIGAVFSGAVFGDHCSPISDTTIVSSIACSVDPMDHVKTQLPYAFIAACGAAFLGFIPVAMMDAQVWLAPISALVFVLMAGLFMSFYRRNA